MNTEIDVKDMPLAVVVDSFKSEITQVLDKAQQVGLPAFVLEEILQASLLTVQKQYCKELAEGYQQMITQMQKQEEQEEVKETSEDAESL